MQPVNYLHEVLIFLIAVVCIVPVFKRFKANPIIGYLAAGAVVGPYGIALIDDIEGAHLIAEFGVVFLFFAIGLELSFNRLRQMKRYVFGLGTAQVLVTGLVIGFVGKLFGLSAAAALVLGGSLALSSSAFVFQLLSSTFDSNKPYGRVVIAILILQDLAVVPLLTFMPLFDETGYTMLHAVMVALLKAVVALFGIVVLGRLVLRPLFRLIANTGSSELFTAMTLLLVLGVSWFTSEMDLSMALGAFLAGLLIAETEYRHQVEADIHPFKGILLGLFFVYVGMTIQPQIILDSPLLIVALVATLLVGKAAIITGLCRLFGLSWDIAGQSGLLLAECGEFAFVLLSVAVDEKILTPDLQQLFTVVVTLSMALTPLLATLGQRWDKWQKHRNDSSQFLFTEEIKELSEHVVIAGFGRVGRTVAELLAVANVPYVGIDVSGYRVGKCRTRGLRVFYGDASQLSVLNAIGCMRAKVAVITVDDSSQTEKIVFILRKNFPDLKIFARAKDKKHGEVLEALGADGLVLEMVESSLQLGGVTLQTMGIMRGEINQIIDNFRDKQYSKLHALMPSEHD